MTSRTIPFRWVPYAVATCLMALGICQTLQIRSLKAKLRSLQSEYLLTSADDVRMRESNALVGLRLTLLEAQEAGKAMAYASSQIMIAWDPHQSRGVVAMQNLPAAPAGGDYQLWVLDPGAPTPISAGLLTTSRSFEVKPLSTQTPGFAISLEPSGGSPVPTTPILFAVAPGS